MWAPEPSMIVTPEAKETEGKAATRDAFQSAIQSHIDAVARGRQYADGNACASYVSSTNAQWAAEAGAFVGWRDAVWTHAYAELDKVQTGERGIPVAADFLAELPPIQWP